MRNKREWNRPYYWFSIHVKKNAFYSYLDCLEISINDVFGLTNNATAHFLHLVRYYLEFIEAIPKGNLV